MTEDTEAHAFHAALASPVRQRVLKMLRAVDDDPTAQQLASALSLHVTTVRFHLDQLEEAGLVARETRRAGRRGRPGVHYRAVPVPAADEYAGGSGFPAVSSVREEMIGALAEALAADDGTEASAPEAARAAGRRWADRLPAPHGDTRANVSDAFTQLGFAPEPDDAGLLLRTCPFRAAARAHPQIVCQVHLGLAERVAERSSDGDQVRVGLVPFVQPELCVLRLDRTTA